MSQIEDEIQTLREVLTSKVRMAHELKRKLGISVWRELSEDVNQGLKNVKESQVYETEQKHYIIYIYMPPYSPGIFLLSFFLFSSLGLLVFVYRLPPSRALRTYILLSFYISSPYTYFTLKCVCVRDACTRREHC